MNKKCISLDKFLKSSLICIWNIMMLQCKVLENQTIQLDLKLLYLLINFNKIKIAILEILTIHN